MIYELYGIPGAGKTTLINKIRGVDTASYSGSPGIRGRLLAAVKKASAYIPSSMAYKREVRRILGNRKMTPHYTSASVAHNLDNIAMVAFGYKHLQGDVYMDEGILHRIMTFAINYDLGIDDALRIIDVFSDCMSRVKSFYLKVPVEECFASIKQRNRHQCEMDEVDDEKLWAFLRKYEAYSEAIAKKYGHRIVTREDYEVLRQ